jgi:DNA-nicking Smr family endonuclease
MGRSPKRAESIDPDIDLDHLADAMAGVVPLAPDHRGRVRATPAVSTQRKAPAPAPSKASAGDDDGMPVAHENEDGYIAPGVDRRELRKIKRGDYVPASVLDLHGQKADEALANVKQFIENSRHRATGPARYRCICIVHGRGLHSKGNISVLKTRVRQYLRHHPGVLAYADAPRTDGGSGAVYVLLRK